MQERYRIFCRAGGNFYARDKVTGKSESLETGDRAAAKQLLAAQNQAVAQPQLNRSMVKAYLSAKSSELLTRTWADVMEHYVKSGVESTRDRKERAFRSRPFAMFRTLTLIDTEAIHVLAVLEHRHAGNSTHHYMRRLHNFALHLGWLLNNRDDVADYCAKYVTKEGAWWNVKLLSHRHPQNPPNLKLTGE
jgi:hypothetical protein